MDLRRLKERAGELWGKGKIAQAEVLYRQMLTRHPSDGQLWVRHGEALKRLARLEAAVGSFRTASQVLAQQGHFHRAVAALKMALELTPHDIELVTDIIRLELQRAQADKAGRGGASAMLPRTVSVDIALEGPDDEPRPMLALPMLEGPRAAAATGRTAQAYPELRRLSDTEVALKASADAAWIVFKSDSNILVRFVGVLEAEDPGVAWLG